VGVVGNRSPKSDSKFGLDRISTRRRPTYASARPGSASSGSTHPGMSRRSRRLARFVQGPSAS